MFCFFVKNRKKMNFAFVAKYSILKICLKAPIKKHFLFAFGICSQVLVRIKSKPITINLGLNVADDNTTA